MRHAPVYDVRNFLDVVHNIPLPEDDEEERVPPYVPIHDEDKAFLDLPFPFRLLLDLCGLRHVIRADHMQFLELSQLKGLLKRFPASPSGSSRFAGMSASLSIDQLVDYIVMSGWVRLDSREKRWRHHWKSSPEDGYRLLHAVYHQGETCPRVDLVCPLEPVSSALQRHPVLGSHDRLMVVSFRGAKCAGPQGPAMREMLTRGFVLGGRRYQRIVQKDIGKKDDEQIWYLALTEEPSAHIEGFQSFNSPQDALRCMVDLSSLRGDIGKMSCRPTLLVSKTHPVDVQNILYEKDILGMSGRNVMTDGCGRMSLDLARRVPVVASGADLGIRREGVPAIQVRVYDPRLGGILSKGVLVPDVDLPENTIVLTQSMVKAPSKQKWKEVESLGRTGGGAGYQGHLTPLPGGVVGVVNTATAGGEERFRAVNFTLMRLLSARGIPDEFFRELWRTEIQQTADLSEDVNLLVRYARMYSFQEIEDMLLAGIPFMGDDLKYKPDCYMKGLITRLQNLCLKKLKDQAPLPGSFSLWGVPDYTQTIEEGCVVVYTDHPLAGGHDVLVYRNPGMHPGDVRKMRLVPPPPELAQRLGPRFTHAVIFSTKGETSPASLMAGGDYDGDHYLVITNSELVEAFIPLSPEQEEKMASLMFGTPKVSGAKGASSSRDGWEDEAALEQALTAHFFFTRDAIREMSMSCLAWRKLATCEDPAHPDCLHLSHVYCMGLDAEKQGMYLPVPPYLRSIKEPCWMLDAKNLHQKNCWKCCSNTSLMDELSAMVRGTEKPSGATEVEVDPDLVIQCDGMAKLIAMWQERHRSIWNKKWRIFLSSKSPGGPQMRSSKEVLTDLVAELRPYIVPASGQHIALQYGEMAKQASACYQAVYNKARDDLREKKEPRTIMVWSIAADVLMRMKADAIEKRQLLRRRMVSLTPTAGALQTGGSSNGMAAHQLVSSFSPSSSSSGHYPSSSNATCGSWLRLARSCCSHMELGKIKIHVGGDQNTTPWATSSSLLYNMEDEDIVSNDDNDEVTELPNGVWQ